MERVDATITLDPVPSRLDVYPLDGAGARLERIPVQGRRFQLQSSPWYEIVVHLLPPRRRFPSVP